MRQIESSDKRFDAGDVDSLASSEHSQLVVESDRNGAVAVATFGVVLRLCLIDVDEVCRRSGSGERRRKGGIQE